MITTNSDALTRGTCYFSYVALLSLRRVDGVLRCVSINFVSDVSPKTAEIKRETNGTTVVEVDIASQTQQTRLSDLWLFIKRNI